MKYSKLAQRVSAGGMQSWEVHSQAKSRQRKGDPIIMLSIGQDADAGPDQAIIERAIESLRAGRHHYTGCQGEPDLREAIAADHFRKTGQGVAADACTVFAGAQNALFSVLSCLLEPGDEVIAPEPYYSTYPATLTAMGAKMISVATASESGFQLDVGQIEAAITTKTQAVVINSPNNPTGAVYKPESLEALANLCAKHDLWLVSDEVYADFCFDTPHCSPASFAQIADRCITISSLSKSHSMPGWRVGWAVTPLGLAGYLTELNLCMLYGLPGFVQDAAVQALSQSEEAISRVRETYRGRRDLVCERLQLLDRVRVQRPQGGMFVMLDIRPLGYDTTEFAMGLLAQHDVAILPADAFGASANGHLRLGLVAAEPVLDEACTRIIEYVNSVPQD